MDSDMAHIRKLFDKAVYIDKSDIWKDPKYREVAIRQRFLYTQLRFLYGERVGNLLEQYDLALADQWEFEIFFFFRQGYLAGRSGK